jgi:glutathione S-transferase
MSLYLFGHPFSSYCQKALIAFYEHGIRFQFRILSPEDPETSQEFLDRWPIRKMPVVVDGAAVVREATVIVEYLERNHGQGRRLIPGDPAVALEARFMDRVFDNYVMTPMQKIVGDRLRAEDKRDPYGVTQARALLDTTYGWLDGVMTDREWAAGENFTLADCAAGPSLFYADWAHPIEGRFPNVVAYRKRLLARPSFARAIDEARPYRPLFPLGAPDRD